VTRTLIVALALVAPSAWACSTPINYDKRVADLQDRADQRAIASRIAREASAVFIGRVTRIDAARGVAIFHLVRPIAGDVPAQGTYEYPQGEEFIIGCSAASMFENTHVREGETYIIYVRDGRISRAGFAERQSRDLSLREETRIARKAASNNKLQRTRGGSFGEQ
jgi:hypothetical protein